MMVTAAKEKIVPLAGTLRLSESQVLAALSCSRTFLWGKISSGEYPPPNKADIGNRWDTATLLAWYAAGMPHFGRWSEHRQTVGAKR